MESSGFYFHIEDNILMLGCGMHIFTKSALQDFREAVADKQKSRALRSAVEKVLSKGYQVGTRHYKRIPRGFTAASDFEEEYLRYNGLTAVIQMDIPEQLFTPGIIPFVCDHFIRMSPIHEWNATYILKN